MPKELTHWILADRALNSLSSSSRLREIIRNHYDCYLWGAVLPDTLLHLLRGPYAETALALARNFHDTAGNSFAPLIRAEQRFPDGLPPAILACLLGVITHIQADIAFHPFVYSVTGTSEIGRHYQLETDIDIHFLRGGSIPPVRKVADLMSSTTLSILLDTGALLFDPDGRLPRHILEHALKLYCRYQGMYDRTIWKLLVTLLAKLAGTPFNEQRGLFYPLTGLRKDRSGEEVVEWRHLISGKLQQTSLEQLADEAVQRITSLYERIEVAGGSLADVLIDSPGENLLTGLHNVCLSTI